MNSTTCKCNGTGYLPRRFYTAARTCSCPLGAERDSWFRLTADEQNARAAAEGAALRAAAIERRHARRAAQKAGE